MISDADNAVALKIDIEYMRAVNWSLLRAGLPLVWKLGICNRGPAPAADLRLRIELPGYLDTGPVALPTIAPGQTLEFAPHELPPWIEQNFRAAVRLDGKKRHSLIIEVGKERATLPIDLLTADEWYAGVGYDYVLDSTVELCRAQFSLPPGGTFKPEKFEAKWPGTPPLQAATAALVLPKHSRIDEIKKKAMAILPDLVHNKRVSLDEWSSGTAEQKTQVVEAVYEAFRALFSEAFHDIEDFSLERWSQRIRFPGESFAAVPNRVHGATCVDYALVWCAVLERCGLYPYFVLVGTGADRCHALVACFLKNDAPRGVLIKDLEKFKKRADKRPGKRPRNMLAVDVTEFSRGIEFGPACESGKACLREPYQFCYALDIRAAWEEYEIEPLPWGIPPNFDSDQRTAYLQTLYEQAARLFLGSVDPKALERGGNENKNPNTILNLDALYTALLTQTPVEQDRSAAASGRGSETRRLSALDQLNRHGRLVLLGEPGGGKSTFVNFVAMCMAGEALGGDRANLDHLKSPLPDKDGSDQKDGNGQRVLQPWDYGLLLPVRIILRDFAARSLPEPGMDAAAKHLWNFIAGTLEDSANGEFYKQMKEELQARGGLVLFDGLDEVPEADRRREQIKQAVESFAAAHPRCRVLVTSRTYAYQNENWRLPGFKEAVLAPFSSGQIRRFVDYWYRNHALQEGLSPDANSDKAEALERIIFANQRLQEFAERPLLLTLMASVHSSRGSLPKQREELYNESVKLLLEWWEQGKIIRDNNGEFLCIQESLSEWLRADRSKVLNLICKLAFQAHSSQADSSGSADIPARDLAAGLFELAGEGHQAVNPKYVASYLRDRAGLLLQRSEHYYAFPHRTFQEYLAACHLADHARYPDELAGLARQEPERWRETALLAGARAAREAVTGAKEGENNDAMIWLLAQALCFRDAQGSKDDSEDTWGAHLAGLLLAESAALDNIREWKKPLLKRIQKWLVRILEDNLLPAVERVAAGNCLARLGDPRFRKEAWCLPADDWLGFVWIPAGDFTMGSDKNKDKQASDDETPQREADLPAYYIGRYPVTVAQFRVFVKDSQYTPPNSKCLEGVDNHPVVYVDWHDAMAYCDWLTKKLREWVDTPADLAARLRQERWRVTLPSEAEWEKAARGTDGRIFPWGDKADPDRANYDKTGIGGTSSVGCFAGGKSPHKCLDMAGNVFEWTRSHKKPYKYNPGDGREAIDAPDTVARVLRGGAFYDFDDYVRGAYRYDDYPDDASNNDGFRVVLSPFSSGL